MSNGDDVEPETGEVDQRLKKLDAIISKFESQSKSKDWQKTTDWFIKNFLIISGLFAAGGTVFIGLWGGSWLFLQTQDLINRTDIKIAEVIGATRPESANIFGLKGEDDRTILYRAALEPRKVGDQIYYRLILTGNLRVTIEGDPGKIVGYYSYLNGRLLDDISVGFDGEPDEVIKLTWSAPYGTNFSENDAEIITNKSSGSISVYWSISLKECGQGLAILEKLTNSTIQDYGETMFLPVFQLIGDSPDFVTFKNVIYEGVVFDCYDGNGDLIEGRQSEDFNSFENLDSVDTIVSPLSE